MRISAKQYAQTLYEITDGRPKPEIEKSVADFARYIYRNRELKLADKIIGQFGKIYNQKKQIIEAEIITWEKLDETLERRAKHYIKEKYQAKEVVLKNIVDDNIKGGMILKVGDEIIDGSVRRKLAELKKALAK